MAVQQQELDATYHNHHKSDNIIEFYMKSVRSEQEAMKLFDDAPVGYCILDECGIIREINNCAATQLRNESSKHLLINTLFWEYVYPDDRDTFLRHIEKTFQTGRQETCEIRLMDKECKPFYVMVMSSATMYFGNWTDKSCLLIFSNITERKLAEENIKASLAEKDLLVRDIHHRIKNHLVAIQSLISLQANKASDANVLSFLKDLKSRVEAICMVHEYLSSSENMRQINFGDYLKRLVNYLRSGYFGSDITLQVHAENICLDSKQAFPCGLIVTELIANAFKHAFPEHAPNNHPEIRIEFKKDKDDLALIVRDNGVGTLPPIKPNFHPDLKKGLGLLLVEAWVTRQLNGSIEVDTTHGTNFKILFKDIENNIN